MTTNCLLSCVVLLFARFLRAKYVLSRLIIDSLVLAVSAFFRWREVIVRRRAGEGRPIRTIERELTRKAAHGERVP